jgi:hypothetical protein
MNASDKSVEFVYFLELIDPLKKHSLSSFAELESAVNNDTSLTLQTWIY